jgi:hypothetical protein
MHPVDLEWRVGRELHRLAGPKAPDTLLPRVMAAVEAWARRPWYEREWFTWPLGWQFASAIALLLMGTSMCIVLPRVQGVVVVATSTIVARVTSQLPDLGPTLDAAELAARILWHALVHPVLVVAFVIVAMMSLACAAVVVALNRVVFGRALNS